MVSRGLIARAGAVTGTRRLARVAPVALCLSLSIAVPAAAESLLRDGAAEVRPSQRLDTLEPPSGTSLYDLLPDRPAYSTLNPVPELLWRLERDYTHQVTYPFRLARRHPVRFGLGAAGLAGLVALDARTTNWVARSQAFAENDLIAAGERFEEFGAMRYGIGLTLGFGALGWIGRSPRELNTALMLTEALVTSTSWTSALKFLSGRQRPGESGAWDNDWTGPGGMFEDETDAQDGPESFPSGHATGAWAIATILAKQYPTHRIVPVLAYSAATAMAFSRVVVQSHWLSDVVAGSLIGYASATQVWNSSHDWDDERAVRGPSFSIGYSSEFRGVVLDVPIE